jgi:hypothetical protein
MLILNLMELGYYERLRIKYYEEEGIEWEYQEDGYSGETKVVPKGIIGINPLP